MDVLAKNIELIQLYDLYQDLLTDKQKDYFEGYYFDDLSITELSENFTVSRNAVHDQLKRTINKLHDYEDKLKLREHSKTRNSLYAKLEEKTTDEELLDIIDELKKVE